MEAEHGALFTSHLSITARAFSPRGIMDQGLPKSSDNAPTYSGSSHLPACPRAHRIPAPPARDSTTVGAAGSSQSIPSLAELPHAITAPNPPLAPTLRPVLPVDATACRLYHVSGRILSRALSIVAACCRSRAALVPIWDFLARVRPEIIWAR